MVMATAVTKSRHHGLVQEKQIQMGTVYGRKMPWQHVKIKWGFGVCGAHLLY